ncbi:MAG: glucose-6-phosphate isomerase [Bdellovibrionota bacterium]
MKWDLKEFSLDLSALGKFSVEPAALNSAHKNLTQKLKADIGFFECPKRMLKELPQIQEQATTLRKQHDRVVCLGIGGSHLGALTLLEALGTPEAATEFPLYWGSNFDPPFVQRARHFMKGGKSPALVVISKSGNTVETLSAFAELCEKETKPLLITDSESGELRRLAREYGWPTLPVPKDVGGRFSVLTAVGLLPAALAGIDTEAVLAGAIAMHDQLTSCEPKDNPAYLLAAAKQALHLEGGYAIQYLMPYWSSLRPFADWYVQLWAESLGKDGKGPSPSAALGSQDQHSLLQLFKEGPRNKLIGFVNVLDETNLRVKNPVFQSPAFSYLWEIPLGRLNRLACDSTQTSLNRSGVPTYRIDLPKLNARAMGALFVFFELSCAFAAELYGVNAFDQPGVEEAKQLLRDALRK